MTFLGFNVLRHIGQKLFVCNHECIQYQQNKCPQKVRQVVFLGSKQRQHLPLFDNIGFLE